MRKIPRILILFGLLLPAGCAPRPPAPDNGVLRVMTYNIHHGENASGRFDLRSVAKAIIRAQAHVVALQEVDRVWGGRSLYMDEAAWLARATGKYLAFGATLDHDPVPNRGEYGLAILSDYPLTSWEMKLLPSTLEQRGVLLAWADTPRGLVPVACLHLGLSTEDREAQVAAALSWLPARSNLLLLGDLNAEPSVPEIQPIFQMLADVQAGCGLNDTGTYFYEGAWRRIDYVFTGSNWQPLACNVPRETASDHYPVVADLKPWP